MTSEAYGVKLAGTHHEMCIADCTMFEMSWQPHVDKLHVLTYLA